MKAIAIIPARSGSKRLPGKNLCEINGKTLLDYAIQSCISSQVFSEIILTSNDQETLDLMANKYADKILYHLRPESLSGDNSKLRTLVEYLITLYEANKKDLNVVIALILPTSPQRTSEDIKTSFALMRKHYADIDGVMSVTTYRHPPKHSLKVNSKGYLEPTFPEHIDTQSQFLEPEYFHDGSIIILKPASFLKHGDFFMPNMVPYYIDPNRAIDINTLFDLRLAEYLMGGSRV